MRADRTVRRTRPEVNTWAMFLASILLVSFILPLSLSAQAGVPTLASITPAFAAQGTTVNVTLTGTNFSPGADVRLSGGGAAKGNVKVVSSTQITATFTLSATTKVGADNVYVVEAAGSSNILPFIVTPTTPLSISLPPSGAPLYPSNTQALTATVIGTGNTGVTWSLSPNVGSLAVSGEMAVYTAPAVINSQQSVTVTVQSVVNSAVGASAVLQLNPPVSVAVSPASAQLYPSSTQALNATVSTGSVTWSISPNVGSLSVAGLTAVYVAPPVITSSQSVTVTAQSSLDTAASASTTLQLTPQVILSVSPSSTVNVEPSGTQQFTTSVLGTTNTAVTWSLQPNVGTISATGLYTAPASVSMPQLVTVTATSAQQTSVSASAQISLQTGVTITMGPAGLSSLAWNGQNLLYNQLSNPTFVQVTQTDSSGTISGAGTRVLSSVVNPLTNTVTQTYKWGVATIQYTAAGNQLQISVAMQNTSTQTLTRYWIYPIALQFPSTPVNVSTNNTVFNLDQPSSVWWDYTTDTIDLVNQDVIQPLALGFWPASSPAASQWWVSLYADPGQNLNPNWPAINRPIPPGATNTMNVSLRFGGPGVTEPQLASDVFSLYAATYPRLLPPVPTHKPIARLSFNGYFRPTFATNPRGWFNDPTVDVTTPAGVAAFQTRLLAAGDAAVAEMQRVGASGGIIWDIEGQQLDQSYIGDPSWAETLAPELVGVLDQFIGKFTAAGFSIGFDLEPQVFSLQTGTVNVSGTSVTWVGGTQFSPAWVNQQGGAEITLGNNNYFIASVQSPTSLTLKVSAGNATGITYYYPLNTNVPNPEPVLQSKVQYARNRWGASLYYVDKDLSYNGASITPAQIFGDLFQEFPGTMYFPEWKNTRHYAYTYPFLDATNGITEPATQVGYVYPQAGGLVRVPADKQILAAEPALIQSVATGNILLFDGWYPHPGNDVVIQIYQQTQ